MAGPPAASAEPAVGPIEGTRLLAYFDTTAPGTFTDVKQVTGLDPYERLEDVDYRWHPNNALDGAWSASRPGRSG